jgi:thioredoxin-like negative regulator of GroEL
LFNIVKAQLEKGDIEGAVTTLKDITDTMNKSFACGEIASAFVKKGELAEAKKLLLGLGDSSREAEAYRRTATAFVENGHAAELANWLDEMPTAQARICACIGAVDGIMELAKK